ncbi:hypothetical protein ABB37_02270 [Leptomonas pyrrhocoris]|uniref:Uncharacterized protein n=1 Tax=Leptomonas pyrrhocoris TaxID=157538 RepID=A0A0N1J587_LEPPY|nr:hypothetical protein ABB37_02270 [Leptomonas pyrrhocoris]KPA84218.1 hypothetical protein ABB37_02270 [Leptomonas pyrrhocoris]|eukprot:XP_015662657.1 hypothetical protein ABB37_02270 [Leptomonas pyrrhocoris]
MFTPRGQNRLPATPPVKIPTLSSPSAGMPAGSTYAPSLSLRRRFGPASLHPEVREIATDTRHASIAGLHVHECDVPSGTVESPPPSLEDVTEVADRKVGNELDKVEDVTTLSEFSSGDADAMRTAAVDTKNSSDGAARAEFLLQKDEFLEGLVRQVRASCAGVLRDNNGEAESAKATRRSPPPRRPSPTSATSPSLLAKSKDGDDWGEVEVMLRAAAPSRPRSRSPSPLSSLALSQKGFVAELKGHANGVVGVHLSPPKSPTALRSGAISPDPRAPSTDFFAAGGVLRSSLQYSRCSGVSRGRRSRSAERPEPVDAAETKEEEDAFWLRAGATAGQRASSLSSERVSVGAPHPQWVPRPVPQARPAWNQRQPPKKQRPVVSAPGSNPPPSSRRSTSRSPEHTHAPSTQFASTRGTLTSAQGSAHSVERAFRRSASLPGVQSPQRVQPQVRFGATVPRSAAVAASASAHQSSFEVAQFATVQSPIDGADATTSPPSPPSARALFQSIDVESATRATPRSVTSASATQPKRTTSTGRDSLSTAQTLQQTCDAAMERATRAEQQCNVLTLALEQLLVEHVAEKAEWRARYAALEQHLSKVTQWIRSIDAEANLPTPETLTSGSATLHTDNATEKSPMHEPSNVESARLPSPIRVMTHKTAAWEEGEEGINLHHGGSSISSAGGSADISPLPGAPGATPTPARRNSAGAESCGTSACVARLPPSPPMILHLHAPQ